MKNTLAVIGVSFDLPNIKNWEDLKSALGSQSSFVGEMPENRLKDIHDAFGNMEMARVGYLDRIDQFDNEYFNFTEREGLRTFPEHRLFLTNAIKAFYHAGYNESSLKGSKTGVFYTAAKTMYHNYAEVSDLTFNNFDFVKGIEATKLAKFLDLRGPVLSVTASCSSSLVALNVARHSLLDGECDMAIVGGVKTLALTKDAAINNVVHSKSGHCRPFDQEADGMINGEGAIFFVLKKYENAIKDGDTILAEIKGVGINHGGSQISSLTAPSSNSQKEVILQAWENAEIKADKIRFIEAHGTGTILGDPIEVEGIKQAIVTSNPFDENYPCALSSFKGQVGHLDYLSGLAGLLRLVAALNFKVIPVQSNFKKLNEHFDFENSGLYIPEVLESWESEDGERIGAVSSFGMTGTNVHIVVSQKDEYSKEFVNDKTISYLQIGHKSKAKLDNYKKYLIEKIEQLPSKNAVNNLCLKLNKIFQVDKENQCFTYSSKETLISALKKQISPKKQKAVLLLDLEVCDYSKEFIQSVFSENLLIENCWNKQVGLKIEDIKSQSALSVLFQFTIYQYLFENLKGIIKFITPKEDTILNKLIKSKISVKEVEKELIKSKKDLVFDESNFKKYIKSNLNTQDVLILDFSKKDKKRFDDLKMNVKVIDGVLSETNLYDLYSLILEAGKKPLESVINPVCYDVDLPYFSPKRFWPSVTKSKVEKTNGAVLNKEKIKEIVYAAWATILETNDIEENEDFFEIGGSSLCAMDVVSEIEKNIAGIKIPFEDIYDFNTILKLTNLIFSQLNDKVISSDELPKEEYFDDKQIEEILRSIWSSLLEIEDFDNSECFFELGGSSLMSLDMIDDIERKFKNIKLDYEDIYSFSTISKLVQKISSLLREDITEEVNLSSEIDFEKRTSEYQTLIHELEEETYRKEIPKNILITGATGLLGGAILDYLINNTTAHLFCLIRNKDSHSAKERFQSIFGNRWERKGFSRIHILEGNLIEPNLGLSKIEERLPSIDMIFHSGGSPQFVSQKNLAEHINFLGTKNVVDWANKKGIKNLNLVSTVGVVGKIMPPQVQNFYETDLNLGQESENLVHGASKLKAEKYIEDHYPYQYKIFRISNIGGRFEDGEFPTNLNKNLMWLRLKSLAQLEYYSEELLGQKSGVSFFPVDILAKYIAEISFVTIEKLNVFHLKKGISFSNGDILMALQNGGWPKEQLSKNDFEKYLNDNNYKMNYLKVASKSINFSFRQEATEVVISKLKLNALLEIDTQAYLERLINTNLKLNNIKVAL